jgi:hypothetical protein
MIKNLTKFRIAKHCLLLNVIFLLLGLCVVDISFAAEEFPWEIFYPAIIKKSIDKDKDGFTKEQGDCNDSNPGINPDATEICGDGIDQDCSGSDLSCNDVDNDGDGYTETQGDCNDGDTAVHPGAAEVCGDSIDQDCDGSDLPCLTCADIAGNWNGNYTEYHCSGVRVDENFSMEVENDCSFIFHFFFGNVSGLWTISKYTISSTVDPGTGECGLYTNIGTVNGNEISGTISSTGGSYGTFYFQKTPN